MPRSDEILLFKGPIIEGALVASRAHWKLFSSKSRIQSEAALAMCWLVYEDEAQAQEMVVKAVERNVVQEDWESEEGVVPHLLEAQEAQEVQDHPSRLPPDRAALAHQGRSPEGRHCRPRCQTHQGCPPRPAASQRR